MLKSNFPNYLTDGALFSKMPEAPWNAVNAGPEMDIAYLAVYSGIKTASHIIRELTKDCVLDQQELADVLWKLYGRNWQRLWDAYMTDYDPISNYDIDDITERGLEGHRAIDRGITKAGSSDTDDTNQVKTSDESKSVTNNSGTETLDGKEHETTDVQYGKKIHTDSETDDYMYAFNSSDKTPTTVEISTSDERQSGNDVTTRDLKADNTTQTTGKTDTTSDSNGSVNSTGNTKVKTSETTKDNTKDDNEEKELTKRTRKGNIGQNTFQELLRQEFELWKWNFYKQVFDDVDKIITLPLYDGDIHHGDCPRFSGIVNHAVTCCGDCCRCGIVLK